MDSRTPVLIGAGQFTYKGPLAESPTPLDLLERATRLAAADAGLGAETLAALDTLYVVGFAVDAGGEGARTQLPRPRNAPKSLAKRLGAQPRTQAYSHMGGNTPQMLANSVCDAIANGESEFALITGAEFLGSLTKRMKQGLGFAGWDDEEAEPPARIGDPRPGTTPQEIAHGLAYPVNTYPLFENAYRARKGWSLDEHRRRLGELFAPFTRMAAANPHAWFPVARSAEELVTVSEANRMVGFPYPKYLNAIMEVDQSAALILTSVQKARELGVDPAKWVFLHGCADAADLWYPLERQNYHSSPAMRLTSKLALEMAGKSLADMDFFDLYSCFPVAVEIACEEAGLSVDDPRGLTLTGGLPYFGGPGNNYAMHGIAEAVARCRARPGSFAMTTGNGWFLTKQSCGIWSTAPVAGAWRRQDPKLLQAEIDALPHPEIIAAPDGPAKIETYTVVHDRAGYRLGIVIGRDAQGRRFVANTDSDPAVLAELESREGVGRPGRVRHDRERNLNRFELD
jgi:acetyl-CoA C-acetyltransferase